jgi:hypothetical protein
MSKVQSMEPDGDSRSPSVLGKRIAELGMLLWMIFITIVWWLLYGPGMTLITERLGILVELQTIRNALTQLVTFRSWY